VVNTVVIDASVALKWVVDEELTIEALSLLRDGLDAVHDLRAPPLLMSEVTNAIHQRVRRGELNGDQADLALRQFLAVPMDLSVPLNLHTLALTFAREHDLSATYDSQYIVLAQSLGADLWTADAKLVRSLPGSLSRVRWLGDYVLSAG
jgi:predicted nucleic acid-binding protein